MTLDLRPTDGNVVVREHEADDKTEGGIIIPPTAQRPPRRGAVVAVGPGALLPGGGRLAPSVMPGDVVLFRLPRPDDRCGWIADILVGNERLLIFRELDVLAVLEET